MKQKDEIIEIFKQALNQDLSDPQIKFIKSLQRWYQQTGSLSERQYQCLISIYKAS